MGRASDPSAMAASGYVDTWTTRILLEVLGFEPLLDVINDEDEGPSFDVMAKRQRTGIAMTFNPSRLRHARERRGLTRTAPAARGREQSPKPQGVRTWRPRSKREHPRTPQPHSRRSRSFFDAL